MAHTSTVGQRFIQLISHLGISKNAFATSLDKTATVVQHIVEERNKPGFDLLCKVFEVYPNVSKDWLLQGQGPMLRDEHGRGGTIAGVPQPLRKDEDSVAKESRVVSGAETAEASPADPEKPGVKAAGNPVAAASASTDALPAATPAPVAAPPMPAAPAVASAPTNASSAPASLAEAGLQAALYAQQLGHQLALAELRNQHLQEQQRMMQQMLDLMQRQLSK